MPGPIDVVRADLTAPDTLDPALDGVDTVFLVWTAPPASAEPAISRIARRVRRIVFLSAPLKTPHPLFQQPNRGRDLGLAIERLIESSGVEWTFLRPGMFAKNSIEWWAPQIRSGDVVRWPYLDVPTAPIHEFDIAAVAVRALTEDGHAGAEYVLTGPGSLTYREQIAIIAKTLGRPLTIEETPPERARQQLATMFNEPVANMLVDAWAAAAGHPAWVTNTVAEITARPARTYAQWAADHSADFTAVSGSPPGYLSRGR